LIAEVHQAVGGGETHIVFPNTPEAEALVNGLGKHAGGFSLHYLQDLGVDERVIEDFISEFIDPALVHTAEQCVWDSTAKSIKTAEEHADDTGMVELEKSSRFIDILAKSQVKEDTKRGKYASVANLFDLDAQSTKTMHEKNDVIELDEEEEESSPRSTQATRVDASKEVELDEMSDGDNQDCSRKEPAGHANATGLREGHTPLSVGVRFTKANSNVMEQVSNEMSDDDELSSTASAAGHVDEVAGRGG
jgi:hypothetical protein